jgi:hypothetical protein
MLVIRHSWLASSLLLFSLLGTAHPACGDERTAAIARLLDVGWAVTARARSEADAQYEEVTRLAGSDPRALEASWLVLMQQRRFGEALKRVDEQLVKSPDDVAALRAKTWIQAVLKNYSAAQLSADRLSAALESRESMDDAQRAVHEEAIGFLGRLMGYFGGPVADSVSQEERKVLEKKILERLPESQRPLLEDARNGVLAKFIEMTDDSAEARERAAAAAKAERDKTLADIESDNEKLEDRAKELEERRKKLNSELKDELTEIDKQEQPLVQQQAQLASRAGLLNSDLLGFSTQIAGFQQLAAQEQNQGQKQQYFNQINSLVLIAGRIEADLLGVNRLLRNVQSQRSGLQVRRNQAQANTAGQIDRLQRELADIDRRGRRNEGLEKRATRSTSASTSKVRALSAQATALSTYDVFPLEAAKARLLESLK